MQTSASQAVEALQAASRRDPSVEGNVYVQVSLSESAVDRRQPHAMLIPLPHRFRLKDESLCCLVVKDPAHAIATELAASEQTALLFDEIIGVGKLRRRVANGRRAKRAPNQHAEPGKTSKKVEEFAKSFALIFVQDKVAEPLTELMGLGYLKRGRHLPIPVSIPPNLTPASLAQLRAVVRASLRAAQLILRPDAKLCSIRVGHTRMDPAKLAENVAAAVDAAKQRIPRGLGSSAKYFLRTPESVALPL